MRIFEHVIDDPRCAKVVLTRNQVESYVSRRIAWATQQWALTNGKDAKKFRVKFDSSEFENFFYEYKAFQLKIKGRLQKTGQTAFYIDYEDTQNIDVVNGAGASFWAPSMRSPSSRASTRNRTPRRWPTKSATWTSWSKPSETSTCSIWQSAEL